MNTFLTVSLLVFAIIFLIGALERRPNVGYFVLYLVLSIAAFLCFFYRLGLFA